MEIERFQEEFPHTKDCKSEKNDSSLEYSHLNPLLIPAITQKVLDFLPIADLKSSRLVCTLWNEESCRISRRKVPVILTMTRQNRHLPQASLAFTNYMLKMADTKSFPHSHYEFRKLLPHHRKLFDPSNDIMECFIARFGPYIKHLHVDILIHDFQFANLLRTVQTKLLNLETFSVTFHNYNHEDFQSAENESFYLPQVKYFNIETSRIQEESYLIKLIPKLFSIMPNVVRVKSACNSLNPYAENGNVMIGVLRSIIEGVAPNLTQVDVLLKLDNEDIKNLIQEKTFKPKNLLMSFGENIVPTNLHALLKKFSKTLEKVAIKSPHFQISTVETFPGGNTIMESLESLTISTFFAGPLNVLSRIPKLKKLKVSNLSIQDVIPESVLFGTKEEHNLEELDITRCTHQEVESLTTITLAFKNLKILSFDAKDATMRIVYENLPQLEELYIIGENVEELTDFGICGIVPEKLLEKENGKSLLESEIQDSLNIGRLQKLTKLKLECQVMTDASVLYGVIRCKKLKNLAVGSPHITEKALNAVVQNLEALQIFDITLCTRDAISFKTLLFVNQEMKKRPTGKFIIDDGRPGNRGLHD